MKNDINLVLNVLRIKQDGKRVYLSVQNISDHPLSIDYISCKESYIDQSPPRVGRVVFGAYLKKGDEATSQPYSVSGMRRADFRDIVSLDAMPKIPLRGGLYRAGFGWKLERQ